MTNLDKAGEKNSHNLDSFQTGGMQHEKEKNDGTLWHTSRFCSEKNSNQSERQSTEGLDGNFFNTSY